MHRRTGHDWRETPDPMPYREDTYLREPPRSALRDWLLLPALFWLAIGAVVAFGCWVAG